MARKRSRRKKKKLRREKSRQKQDVQVKFKVIEDTVIEIEEDPWERYSYFLIVVGIIVFILLLWEAALR